VARQRLVSASVVITDSFPARHFNRRANFWLRRALRHREGRRSVSMALKLGGGRRSLGVTVRRCGPGLLL